MDGVQKGRRKQFRVIKSETLSPRLTCHPMSRRVGCKLQSAVGVLHHKSLYNSALHDYYVLLAFFALTRTAGIALFGRNKRLSIANIKLNVMEVFLCASRRATSLHQKSLFAPIPTRILSASTFHIFIPRLFGAARRFSPRFFPLFIFGFFTCRRVWHLHQCLR